MDLVQAAESQLDTCIDFVGAPVTTTNGIAALGRGGTFVVVDTLPALRSHKSAVMTASPMYLVNKEITIMVTRYVTRAEIARALGLVRDGKVKSVDWGLVSTGPG